MIEIKRSKKFRSKNSLFNPYINGISSYDLTYLSSKKVLKKTVYLQSDSQKDYLAAWIMPYVSIYISEQVEDKKKFLEEISILFSSLTKKSKRFVMARLEDDSEMYFEDENPCCFLQIKSIGSLNPSGMVKPISDFVYENLGISKDKIYISFEDVPASMWAWNGKTFG